ncbi:holin family protein [Thiovibrio frasassiensis]|uniref:Holin family protein n=1 Tax=Thiovibrio frasassiensis TaxID=2984131 RepID=A0A9X4MEX9_9BACT|nr:holin family protein [Thiovibrio frasassiensis]MDG4475422.1 holin family protein [Thiovibrio frasassiensis]
MGLDLTGLGSVADLAKGLVNRFFPPAMSDTEKAAAQIQIEQMLEQRETALIDLQRSVITAEMAQGDNYTKRARPTIVYFGLGAIGLVHVLLPVLAWLVLTLMGKPIVLPTIALPEQFWLTWGGVCSIWMIGRSAEKRGQSGKMLSLITGSK